MQKVVSIYFDSYTRAGEPSETDEKRKWYQPRGDTVRHGAVQEHLEEYLREGWSVVSVTGLGGARPHSVGGWAVVVLEWPD